MKPRRRAGRVVLAVLAVLLVLVVSLWLYLDFSMKRVAAFADYGGRPAATAGTNWLMVGSDSRENLTEAQKKELGTGDVAGGRTDTIMLLHIPDSSGQPTLVSLPRDTLVPINGHGKDKLNAAYAYGGPTLLTRTVEEVTHLRIDHYAEIGLDGFAGVVDAVGGVRMCIDKPMHDPKAALDLNPGCQDLNGTQALGYVRTRAYARADLERVEHQRQFLSALVSKSTSFGVLANPFQSIPMALGGVKAVTVGDGDHLHNVVGLAFAMSGGLVTTTAPVASTPTVPGVGSVVLWDESKASRLFGALGQDKPLPADVITRPGG
jgi:LCP family protein required for cell wall assembly